MKQRAADRRLPHDQRMTNRTPWWSDLCGMVRAVAHTIASRHSAATMTVAGLQWIPAPGGRPATGLATTASGAGQVAVGDDQLDEGDRRDDDQRHQRRAERNPHQIIGAEAPGCRRDPARFLSQLR